MSRQKRLDLLYWARSLKISYLWRCEEYGGLAQIAHGVELGPENKSFTIDCGFAGHWVLRAWSECNILSIIKGV